MNCLNNCCHYEIPDYLMKIALEDEKRCTKNYGSTRPLNERRDFIGSLGQNGFFEMCEYEWGIPLEEKSPYTSDDNQGDEYDGRHRGSRFDVKTSPLELFPPDWRGDPRVWPKSRLLIKQESEEKNIGIYIFCKVDLENSVLHFPGLIDYGKFWGLRQTMGAKWPANYALASQLQPVRNWVFGTA